MERIMDDSHLTEIFMKKKRGLSKYIMEGFDS
jgi:hypothetical protein